MFNSLPFSCLQFVLSFGYAKELISKVTLQKFLNFKDLADKRKNIIKLSTRYTKEKNVLNVGEGRHGSVINELFSTIPKARCREHININRPIQASSPNHSLDGCTLTLMKCTCPQPTCLLVPQLCLIQILLFLYNFARGKVWGHFIGGFKTETGKVSRALKSRICALLPSKASKSTPPK